MKNDFKLTLFIIIFKMQFAIIGTKEIFEKKIYIYLLFLI